MKVVLLHGMFKRKGKRAQIDAMAPQFRRLGYDVHIIDYGFWDLFRVYLGNKKKLYQKISRALIDADLICAHSYGGAVSDGGLCLLDNARVRVLVLLAPSLNRGTPPPSAITHRFVFHSKGDFIIWASSWLPFLKLGRMGAVGYTGKALNNTNLDHSDYIGSDHDEWFDGHNADLYAIQAHNLAKKFYAL